MTIDGLSTRRSPHGCVWPAAWYRPHASAWAIWSKLCDANAMTSPSAATLLEGTGRFRSLFETRPDARWLLEAHTLTPDDRRNACVTVVSFRRDAVEFRWVRYCPICLTGGYHAGCFQHRAVTRCPLHDVPLRDHCPHCGRRVPAGFENARAAPFGCRACGLQLAQAQVPQRTGMAQLVPIAATAAALTAGADHIGAPSGRRRAPLGRPAMAGHASWWSGVDPFVAGSAWIPQRMAIAVATDDPFTLQQLAWQVLIRFVEAQVVDPVRRSRVVAAADALERRNLCMLTGGLSRNEWAVAALVTRYGTAEYVRAQRLLRRGCDATLFPLVPQASSFVGRSAEANATVFAAEVRAEYLRLLKWSGRAGRMRLFETDLACGATAVPWQLVEGEDEWWLQWRALRERRFNRARTTHLRAAVQR